MAFFDVADISSFVFFLLIVSAFVAGYIDSVAGGGGMIQTLALLMAGVSPVQTLATNKIVSVSGTITAVTKYAKARAINWRLTFICIIPCVIAAAIGSKIVMYFSDSIIRWMIIFCIPVALSVIFIKSSKVQSKSESTSAPKAVALMTPIAFYDGLIGPGTGTYMAIAGTKGLNMSFLRATGLAKPLNLSTNIGSALVYLISGKILWILAVPMALASVCGAYWGSHSAIKHGDAFIKKVMLIMLVAMLIVNLVRVL
ncbi:MAG: TSUP family transporter [Gammaproteobacteria bacterium]|nr:TSUP family transporter [Gammaproteobacteria bacterium]